jgi:hypothetical protein
LAVYQLGRLSVALEGENIFAGKAIEEIELALPRTAGEPAVRMEFRNALPDMDYRRVGSVLVGDEIRIERSGLRYAVSGDGFPAQVSVAPMADGLGVEVMRQLRRFRDRNFLYPEEAVARTFIYDVFDWVTHLGQIDMGQSYVHASAMCREGRGIAFLAWCGVGKTTALLKLCSEDGWKYLSDDLALIDDEGTLYRTPRKIQLYAHNLAEDARLTERLLKSSTMLDRAAWQYHLKRNGTSGVRRRVAPEVLFGSDGVAASARLSDLVFLDSVSQPGCTVFPMTAEAMAARMAPIVLAELDPFTTLFREAEANGVRLFRDPRDTQEKTRQILSKAFANARPIGIKVGPGTTPSILADVIRRHVLEG